MKSKNENAQRKPKGVMPIGSKDVFSGVELIAKERARQLCVEGWTPEHDDAHDCGEMAVAAKCYIEQAVGRRWLGTEQYQADEPREDWPWDRKWWKPKSSIRDLVRAGALIAAEIDRLKRAEAKPENDGAMPRRQTK